MLWKYQCSQSLFKSSWAMIYNAIWVTRLEEMFHLLHQSDDIIPPASNSVVLCFILSNCPNKNPQQHMNLSPFNYIIDFNLAGSVPGSNDFSIWESSADLICCVEYPSTICHGRDASGLTSLQPWKFQCLPACTTFLELLALALFMFI